MASMQKMLFINGRMKRRIFWLMTKMCPKCSKTKDGNCQTLNSPDLHPQLAKVSLNIFIKHLAEFTHSVFEIYFYENQFFRWIHRCQSLINLQKNKSLKICTIISLMLNKFWMHKKLPSFWLSFYEMNPLFLNERVYCIMNSGQKRVK